MRSKKEHGQVGLPPGHCTATLGEVTGEAVSQTGPAGTFIYLDIGAVDRESKTFVEPKLLNPAEAPSRAKQVVHTGDVLVSMTRPNLNAIAMVPEGRGETVASTGFHVLRSAWVDPNFLYYLVQTDVFIDAMSAVVQGALYPAVRPKDISDFQFNLPPRAEQTRIVEKLEELLSDLEAGVAELKAAQRKLAQYRQSLLKAAVEGALTADWRAARTQSGIPSRSSSPRKRGSSDLASETLKTLDSRLRRNAGKCETGPELLQRILTERRTHWEQKQLTKFAEQGKIPSKDWQTKYPPPAAPNTANLPPLPDGWAWASIDQLSPDDLANGRSVPSADTGAKVLRLTSVKDGRIDLGEYKTGAWSEDDARPFAVAKGDFLVIRGNGSLSLVGRGGLVGDIFEQIAYPDTLIRLRVIDSVVLPEWIRIVWDTRSTRSHLEKKARTSAGIYKISQPDLLSVVVPVPPLIEQLEVVRQLEGATSSVAEQEVAIQTVLKQATAQRKNILKAAFAGQLVPQDPDDEPASALLERIRTARADADTTNARKRGRKAKETA